MIQTRLDNVCDSSEVGASVGIDDALGFGRCAGSKRDGEHVIFVVCVRVKPSPALGTLLGVVSKTLCYSLIILACMRAVEDVSIL